MNADKSCRIYILPNIKENNDVFEKSDMINFKSHSTSAGNILKKLHDIPCPYFGTKMLSGSDMINIERRIDKAASLSEAVAIIDKNRLYLQKIEKKIFSKLKKYIKENPQKTVHDFLNSLYDEAFAKLKIEEFKVIDKVNSLSNKLSPNSALKIREQTTLFTKIILENDSQNTFKRKTFLSILNNTGVLKEEAPIFEKILDKAIYLPTSNTSENAFIVKYQTRSDAEVLKRLLRASVATIEHIKPSSLGGKNELSNFILASSSANSFRSNMPLVKFIEKFKKVPQNCQAYIEEIIRLINTNKLKDCNNYPKNVRKTLLKESDNLINLDISTLK